MLDSVTKKRIDGLRDILVGKIPTPEGQVEQITTGLVYKFMYDMDADSIEMGGEPSYFVGEYEKYSWKHLFNPKLSGVEKVELYDKAIKMINTNPNVPEIFRDIFKNADLPYKDSQILNLFLKEINEFNYSHSENLGDAYEYLLSFMGTQGNAGQFRTPRHIIDFIVEIVNPQKNETILDPACGTAGFLISAYKHILVQNTDKMLGDKITAKERKKIDGNFVGYDIEPIFNRISLVNMHLHDFTNPNIHEYDTLTSEERWNEYFDVILANPPFFSPRGGIKPHSRFGIKSTRAEALFVDYIIEHLKPQGRAGIIVPEGIIFKIDNAYKNLRKKLVEGNLVGVISLPAGVFQPYSGVKTSVLILDKKLGKKSKDIFIVKINNDGFSLSKQRTPIKDNDLPRMKDEIIDYMNGKLSKPNLIIIDKEKILAHNKITLDVGHYLEKKVALSEFKMVNLTDYADLKRGETITEKETVSGNIPVIAGGQKPAYFHNKSNRDSDSITISSSGAYAGFVSFHPYPIFASDCFTVISKSNNLDQKFLYFILKSKQNEIYNMQSGGGQPHVYAKNFNDFKIPLPPTEIQSTIGAELAEYQKVIDGCKQIIESYRPIIDIDPSWKQFKIGNLCKISRGGSPRPIREFITNRKDGINWIKIGDVAPGSKYITQTKEKITPTGAKKSRKVKSGDFILSNSMSFGRPYILRIDGCIHDGWLQLEYDKSRIDEDFLYYILSSKYLYDQFSRLATGGVVNNLNKELVASADIPLPSMRIQKEIAEELEERQETISDVERLIETYNQKIQDKISQIWAEA